jgi:hypothetical protein
MQRKFGSLMLSVFLCVFELFALLPAWAQLIEPTRSLNQEPEPKSRLTVLSEPPGLEVILDGTEIGTTPIFGLEVDAGTHVVRIENKKASIKIAAGKNFQIVLFKGSFVEVPQREEGVSQSEAEKQIVSPPTLIEKTSAGGKTKSQDPFYWPLKPSGPIY